MVGMAFQMLVSGLQNCQAPHELTDVWYAQQGRNQAE